MKKTGTADYQNKVQIKFKGYYAIHERKKKEKKHFDKEFLEDELKGKSFVQYDSGKYYLLNLKIKEAETFVLYKIGQAFRDANALDKTRAKKANSRQQNQSYSAVPRTYASIPAQDSVSSNFSEASLSSSHSSSPFENSSNLSRASSQSGAKRKDRDNEEEEERNNVLHLLRRIEDPVLNELIHNDTRDNEEETMANTDDELAQKNNQWDSLDLEGTLDDIVKHHYNNLNATFDFPGSSDFKDTIEFGIELQDTFDSDEILMNDNRGNEDTENGRKTVTENVANTDDEPESQDDTFEQLHRLGNK